LVDADDGAPVGAVEPAVVPGLTTTHVTFYVPARDPWFIWINDQPATNDVMEMTKRECALEIDILATGGNAIRCRATP